VNLGGRIKGARKLVVWTEKKTLRDYRIIAGSTAEPKVAEALKHSSMKHLDQN